MILSAFFVFAYPLGSATWLGFPLPAAQCSRQQHASSETKYNFLTVRSGILSVIECCTGRIAWVCPEDATNEARKLSLYLIPECFLANAYACLACMLGRKWHRTSARSCSARNLQARTTSPITSAGPRIWPPCAPTADSHSATWFHVLIIYMQQH